MTIEDRLHDVRTEYLRYLTQGHGHLLQQVEQFLASRQGKMLRPRMLLTAAATLGEDCLASRRTLLLATAVEILHNASLLHDDVVDHATSRRGLPSVNAQWNSRIAILVGDYHLAMLMRLLDEVDDSDAARRINETVLAMVEGELLQQEILCGKPMTHEDYLRIIDGKTACLFATAAALGNPRYEAYGLHYGRIFQLHDDLADDEATPFTNDLINSEQQALSLLQETLSL